MELRENLSSFVNVPEDFSGQLDSYSLGEILGKSGADP